MTNGQLDIDKYPSIESIVYTGLFTATVTTVTGSVYDLNADHRNDVISISKNHQIIDDGWAEDLDAAAKRIQAISSEAERTQESMLRMSDFFADFGIDLIIDEKTMNFTFATETQTLFVNFDMEYEVGVGISSTLVK